MKSKRKAKPLPFTEVVRRWRTSRKLTKVQAAARLGVPYRTFQDWELGNRTPRGIARNLLIRKLSILVAVLALSVSTAYAAGSDGNYWREFTHQQKLYYLNGLYDGMVRAMQNDGRQPRAILIFGGGNNATRLITFADGLDVFYRDFRNRDILIADAIVPVALAANGRPDAEIKTAVEAMRQQASVTP